jgi:2-polyprenyl-6-hydroxyphenyl methylase/3-demethylubiquinone-9 3-methyltransferase
MAKKRAAAMEAAAPAANVDPDEIAQFSALAATWWDADGPFGALHAINPLRLGYIRKQAEARFGLDAKSLKPLRGLAVLDIGCGGGLVSEPLARMGATVLGIDAAEDGVKAAQAHAEGQGLALAYRATSAEELAAEDLAAEGKRFDIVTALEIVEHVPDPQGFLKTACALVKPGGLIVVSTLNRSLPGFVLGKVAAEYILRAVPPGTHDFRKFLKPGEVASAFAAAGVEASEPVGITFDPRTAQFALTPGRAPVNYLMSGVHR